MGREIPAFAWVILGFLVVIIVAVNLALIMTFLGRSRSKGDSPTASHSQRAPFNDLPETIRHPWHREDEMLEELSKQIKAMQDLKENRK